MSTTPIVDEFMNQHEYYDDTQKIYNIICKGEEFFFIEKISKAIEMRLEYLNFLKDDPNNKYKDVLDLRIQKLKIIKSAVERLKNLEVFL